jgi:hypothetical protein
MCVAEGNAALNLNKPSKWWRDRILKGELQGKSQKDGFTGGWLWTLRDSSDPSDSSEKSREKRRSLNDRAPGETTEKSRETSEESQDSQHDKSWTAPEANPGILQTPFDEENDP